MNAIVEWFLDLIDRLLTGSSRWIDQRVKCPECGHGMEKDPAVRAEQAYWCTCSDEDCFCHEEP